MEDAATETIDVEDFRRLAVEYLETALAAGTACPSFGTIMPPEFVSRAQMWQAKCFEAGFAGIDWPREFGGRGLSATHATVWAEECARIEVAPYMNFQGFVLAGGAILKFGTPDQKTRYLGATLAADLVWCQLFSEPGSGSDLVSLSTRAESTGDGWVITGQKVWSSTAQLADMAILLARTDAGEPGHRGISFFLLDMSRPGIDVRPLRQMTGDSEFCEVFLDGVIAEQTDLLGPLNGGWMVATSVLADERAHVGAAGIGLSTRLARLRNGDRTESQRADLARLTARGEALGKMLARSGGDPMLGPLTKLALTELSGDLAGFANDVRGPGGMLNSASGDAFLYAPGMRVAGGTSEIQRNLVGERLLGLPREPRPIPKS